MSPIDLVVFAHQFQILQGDTKQDDPLKNELRIFSGLSTNDATYVPERNVGPSKRLKLAVFPASA